MLDELDEIKSAPDTNSTAGLRVVAAGVQDLRRVDQSTPSCRFEELATAGMTEMNALPANARRYVDFLSEQIGVEIGLVSTGPEAFRKRLSFRLSVGRWLKTSQCPQSSAQSRPFQNQER